MSNPIELNEKMINDAISIVTNVMLLTAKTLSPADRTAMFLTLTGTSAVSTLLSAQDTIALLTEANGVLGKNALADYVQSVLSVSLNSRIQEVYPNIKAKFTT